MSTKKTATNQEAQLGSLSGPVNLEAGAQGPTGPIGEKGAPGPAGNSGELQSPSGEFTGPAIMRSVISDTARLTTPKVTELEPVPFPDFKQDDLNKEVYVEKEGHTGRTMTLLQLSSMGQDTGGETFDGWKITGKPQTPKEIADTRTEAEKAIDMLGDALNK